ncbi:MULTISPECIES: autotransporter outer membrane beta-barrel domain-containing protein [unclassified Microbulbifer]|uniref:autotransporter family protein n=1 Tax=unclassified Microbulbifer TaxID=2619833 RepID=UPI0027E48A48|nr:MULTISPECIES: autotransporter outer membrane beta-barrel domain-containing protein [unclassified Microbulbifer]
MTRPRISRIRRAAVLLLTLCAGYCDPKIALSADSDSLPTRLIVGPGSVLRIPELNARIAPPAGRHLLVENRGSIDLRGNTANHLTIGGDYIGSGTLHLDAVLLGDDSPADRLVIDGGHATGSTEIQVNWAGGRGEQTDTGILLVEATGDGSTADGAFHMQGSLSAGPYEYFLFRGAGGNRSLENNWYLRSSVLPGSAPPAAGTSSPTLVAPAPPPGAAPLPLYRPEIPLYAQAKPLAHRVALEEVGSYHDRCGDQGNWTEANSCAWVRLHHKDGRLGWGGAVENRFDGRTSGFQLGANLFSWPTDAGLREWGLFFGGSRTGGDVRGFARGFKDYHAGHNELDSYYLGGYMTHHRADRGYLDIVFRAALLELESLSTRDIGDTVRGPQLTISVEKGFTFAATDGINLEPQLQAVANYTNLSAFQDGISLAEPDMTPEATLRAGLRGYNSRGNNRYYLFTNLWHTLSGNDELLFGKTRLDGERRASWAEIGAGFVWLERRGGSAFANIGYQRSIDDLDWEGGSANLGFDWRW